MAQLVVRNLDKAIVDALKKRAARHGHSAEAEHRAILSEALLRPKKKVLPKPWRRFLTLVRMKILSAWKNTRGTMYLIDTNVISEYRKKNNANKGVRTFFRHVIDQRAHVFLSVVTIGELRRGVELIRHRGDVKQAKLLEKWLSSILDGFQDYILDVDKDTAQVWGKLRVPHHENALDKQIAATALIHDLTLVTRNETHFNGTGVRIINPFED